MIAKTPAGRDFGKTGFMDGFSIVFKSLGKNLPSKPA